MATEPAPAQRQQLKVSNLICDHWTYLVHFSCLCGSRQPAADRWAVSGFWLPRRCPEIPLQWHSRRWRPGLPLWRPNLQESSPVHKQRSDPWEVRFKTTRTRLHKRNDCSEWWKAASTITAFSLYVVWAGYEPGQGNVKVTTQEGNGKQYTSNLEGLDSCLCPWVYRTKFSGYIMGCIWHFGDEKQVLLFLWTSKESDWKSYKWTPGLWE